MAVVMMQTLNNCPKEVRRRLKVTGPMGDQAGTAATKVRFPGTTRLLIVIALACGSEKRLDPNVVYSIDQRVHRAGRVLK